MLFLHLVSRTMQMGLILSVQDKVLVKCIPFNQVKPTCVLHFPVQSENGNVVGLISLVVKSVHVATLHPSHYLIMRIVVVSQPSNSTG